MGYRGSAIALGLATMTVLGCAGASANAVDEVDVVLSPPPPPGRTAREIGTRAGQLGNFDKCVTELRHEPVESTRAHNQSGKDRYQRAFTHETEGRVAKARKAYFDIVSQCETATRDNRPAFCSVEAGYVSASYFGSGELFLAEPPDKLKLDLAGEAYEKVLELEPAVSNLRRLALLRLAEIRTRQGNPEESLHLYWAFFGISGGSWRCHDEAMARAIQGSAVAYVKAGNPPKSASYFWRVGDPEIAARILIDLGRVYLADGDRESGALVAEDLTSTDLDREKHLCSEGARLAEELSHAPLREKLRAVCNP